MRLSQAQFMQAHTRRQRHRWRANWQGASASARREWCWEWHGFGLGQWRHGGKQFSQVPETLCVVVVCQLILLIIIRRRGSRKRTPDVSAASRSRRRSSRVRRPDTTPNKKKRPRIARGILQSHRLALGTANALRDRILQHEQQDGSLPHNMKKMLKEVQKKITKLQNKITKTPTVADVSASFC